MNYFDPARPRLGNNEPMYVDAAGVGIAALPRIAVEPIAEQLGGLPWVTVSVMLKVGSGAFSWFERDVPVELVGSMLSRWLEDPEAVLREDFNYRGAGGTPLIAPISAEEAGL